MYVTSADRPNSSRKKGRPRLDPILKDQKFSKNCE